MNRAVRLLVLFTTGIVFFGCTNKGGDQPGSKAEQKAGVVSDKDLALKFLQGVQNSDKKMVYEAANLTTEIVEESREKLIHPAKYSQTNEQKQSSEHALRASGNIDFFISKIIKLLPKSARIQITQVSTKVLGDGSKIINHTVKVAYENKDDAMSDETGRPVKEIVLHLLQLSRSVNGRLVHDFSFDSNDFNKIADKDFEVLSYY